MVSNPSEFDENCQCNIEWIGSQFLSEISRIPNSNNEELNIIIDDLYSIVYRFLWRCCITETSHKSKR